MPTYSWLNGKLRPIQNVSKIHYTITGFLMISGVCGNILNMFLSTLNNHNVSIKLKSTINKTTIDFLETTTFKGRNFSQTHKLDIKVFFKSTDTHALLFKTSFHPKRTFAGLIKSQLLRFHRICTQQTDFRAATEILFSALATRGYCHSFLRKCLKSSYRLNPLIYLLFCRWWSHMPHQHANWSEWLRTIFKILSRKPKCWRDCKVIAAFRKFHLSEPELRDQGQFFSAPKMVAQLFKCQCVPLTV